ncbi:MAG: hypothetical protein R3A47_09155 [Polyangiales bacterium]
MKKRLPPEDCADFDPDADTVEGADADSVADADASDTIVTTPQMAEVGAAASNASPKNSTGDEGATLVTDVSEFIDKTRE